MITHYARTRAYENTFVADVPRSLRVRTHCTRFSAGIESTMMLGGWVAGSLKPYLLLASSMATHGR